VHGPEYWSFAGACVLNRTNVEELSLESLSATIIHEGIHARLHRARIPYSEAYRPRVESACIRAELSFLERLPGTAPLVNHLRANLSGAWYTDTQLRDRLASRNRDKQL